MEGIQDSGARLIALKYVAYSKEVLAVQPLRTHIPLMFQGIKQFYGARLIASDGVIGHVKDFYFDDQEWAVRYVDVDTGSWLSERLVLLSPHAFGNFRQNGDGLPVNLTRRQIENGPSIDSHKPISRQYEEDYYAYYGWPSYWEAGGFFGMPGFPVAPPPHLVPEKDERGGSRVLNGDDPHLRSTKALNGYHIQTSEGAIGEVTDFIMDDKSWTIHSLLVDTGHYFSGKEIAISPQDVESISYLESKVFVKKSKKALLEEPEYIMPPLGKA